MKEFLINTSRTGSLTLYETALWIKKIKSELPFTDDNEIRKERGKQSNKSSLSSPDKLMFTVKREEKSNRPT